MILPLGRRATMGALGLDKKAVFDYPYPDERE